MSVNLKKIKRELINKYKFLGGVIDNTNYFETSNCVYQGIPTAATDGTTVFYHPDIDKYSEKQQLFLFAHEISHIVLEHHIRCGDRDRDIWNIATDAVINAQLVSDGFELADGAIDIPWAKGHSAEEVYQILLQDKKKHQDGSNSSDDKDKESGHDSHEWWDQNQDKKGQSSISEKELFDEDISDDVKEKMIDFKSKQSTKSFSKYEGQSFQIDHVDASSMIRWQDYLRKPHEDMQLDWSYQNSYIEDGVVIANLEEQPYYFTYQTEILLDTSGSVSNELLRSFLRECKNILKFSRIKVGCFDEKFYGFQDIKNEKDIDQMIFVGRGGTNFDVAINAFSKDAQNRIIFTDGDADMPSRGMYVIWVVFGDRRIQPLGGKVFYVDENKILQPQLRNNINKELIKVR